jgi:hypothetical protein
VACTYKGPHLFYITAMNLFIVILINLFKFWPSSYVYVYTAGYTWRDYKANTQIAKELKITPILDRLLEYKRTWI